MLKKGISLKPRSKNDKTTQEIEQLKIKSTEIPGLVEFAHHAGSAPIRPNNSDQIKNRALKAMHEQTHRELNILYQQMETAAKQVKLIRERMQFSQLVYDAEIRFQPLVGESYYLYEKLTGEYLLSLVAPQEWGKDIPFKSCVAKVILLSDHTWEIAEKYKPT